jgi:hypothetical protein
LRLRGSPSLSLCAASGVATVAALLHSAGGVIVPIDAASHNCDSSGASRGAWLAAAIGFYVVTGAAIEMMAASSNKVVCPPNF